MSFESGNNIDDKQKTVEEAEKKAKTLEMKLSGMVKGMEDELSGRLEGKKGNEIGGLDAKSVVDATLSELGGIALKINDDVDKMFEKVGGDEGVLNAKKAEIKGKLNELASQVREAIVEKMRHLEKLKQLIFVESKLRSVDKGVSSVMERKSGESSKVDTAKIEGMGVKDRVLLLKKIGEEGVKMGEVGKFLDPLSQVATRPEYVRRVAEAKRQQGVLERELGEVRGGLEKKVESDLSVLEDTFLNVKGRLAAGEIIKYEESRALVEKGNACLLSLESTGLAKLPGFKNEFEKCVNLQNELVDKMAEVYFGGASKGLKDMNAKIDAKKTEIETLKGDFEKASAEGKKALAEAVQKAEEELVSLKRQRVPLLAERDREVDEINKKKNVSNENVREIDLG